MIMASEIAGDDNNQTCIKRELLSTSLALALKEEDAEKFLQIYDSSIPNSLAEKKVEEIKERARELSEKSAEELETLRADLQAGQDLILEVFQNVKKLNGYNSVIPDKKDKARRLCGPVVDRNHNLLPRLGLAPFSRAMTLKTDEKEDNSLQTKDTDLGAIKTVASNALKGQSPESENRQVLDESTTLFVNNKTTSEGMASGFVDLKGQQEVDARIQFVSLKKTAESSSSLSSSNVTKMKTNNHGKNRDVLISGSRKDTGPYPPAILLKNSAALISKPKDDEVKNCPPPAPIISGQGTEIRSDEATPILSRSRPERGNKSPLKRHGEQQKERELEEVFVSPAVSPIAVACNFTFQNYGSCNNMHDTPSNKIVRDESNIGDGTRKKKRKKKKKTKQGDNGTESTTEGEDARSPPNGLISPISTAEMDDTKRKTSAESSSERENLSGENECKLLPGQKAKHSKDNARDKGNRTKTVEGGKKKKPDAKKKTGNEGTSKGEKKWSAPENEAAMRQLAKCELEVDVFASLRRRTVDDASNYGKDESEPDCRAAMSDPGENDDDHGGFNVVKNRKSRRREKGASHFGFNGPFSKNFWTDYSPNSNFGRSKDSVWDLRKSSSLPKEMCKYSNSRRRLGTNDTEELVSTTTTTTTASSRRDSLESDENSYDQKKQSGFSYASRLRANIPQGCVLVQSPKEGEKEPRLTSNNPEGTTAPLGQSNSKSKMNSTMNDIIKSDIGDRTDFNKSSHQESKDSVLNVPSSSISTAMNLEVSPTRKFDLNFPNLTSSIASSSSRGPGFSEDQSVQYLDLECTNNSYAGRVKQSLVNNSNTPTTMMMRRRGEEQSLRTMERNEKSTIEGHVWPCKDPVSSNPHQLYSGEKGEETEGVCTVGTIENKEKKDEHCKRFLWVDNERVVTTSSVVTDVDKETTRRFQIGSSVHADSQEIEVITTTTTNSLPLSSIARVPPSNPIWFGSLIVSDEGIVDLGECPQPLLCNESPGNKLGHSVVSRDRVFVKVTQKMTDEWQSQAVDENLKDDSLKGNVLKQVMTGGEQVSDNTVMVELLSSKKVKFDINCTWLKTRTFNHRELTEMLRKDWEAIVKQRRDCPDSVCIASD